MNTASRLDINWPHPRGNCVSVSHITVVTSGCHNVTTLGSVITEYGSSVTATPWLRREPRTDLWTGAGSEGCSSLWCVHCAVHPYCCHCTHCTHCTGNTCDHRLHCTVYTTNNTRLVTLRFTHWLRFPSLRLHASDNDDHWAIKRKSHTGFTFLWRQ